MKSTNTWIIVAVILCIIGCVVFIVGMSFLRWDFSKLSTYKMVKNTYEITQNYSSISIDTTTAGIKFVPSLNGETSVVCYEREKLTHSVEVVDGELTIKVSDKRQWYDHIGFSFSSPQITVTLPQNAYEALSINTNTGDLSILDSFTFSNATINTTTGKVSFSSSVTDKLKITATTGDITIKNASAKETDISTTTGKVNISSFVTESLLVTVSTGDTTLSNVQCASLSTKGSTGSINLHSVIASQKISIEIGTGNIKFDGCDAGEIQAKTSTGSITGTLLSSKIFIASSQTGNKQVPETTEGGICRLTTTTGNIRISIK